MKFKAVECDKCGEIASEDHVGSDWDFRIDVTPCPLVSKTWVCLHICPECRDEALQDITAGINDILDAYNKRKMER